MSRLDPLMWTYKINDKSINSYKIACYDSLKEDVINVCLMGCDNILNQYIQDIATHIFNNRIKIEYRRESKLATAVAPISLLGVCFYTVVFDGYGAAFHKVDLPIDSSTESPKLNFIPRSDADITLAGIVPESFIGHWNTPHFLKEEQPGQ